MNDAAAIALVAVALWLGTLTLVMATLVRQVAIHRARLELGLPRFTPATDGPELGSLIPDEVKDAIPELRRERVYLLVLSSVCAPCRELAPRLRGLQLADRIVALVPGNDPEVAGSLAELLPPEVRTIKDPEAVALARALRIQSTPFALELEADRVTGKAYLYDVSYLQNLVAARRKRQQIQVISTEKEVIARA